MKKLCLFLLLTFITYIYLETNCIDIEKPKSASDCNGKLSDYDKNNNKYTYCCYMSYSKKSELNQCLGVSQSYYDNIEKYMKISIKQNEIDKLRNEIDPDKYKYEDLGKVKIKCNSNYLKIEILFLFLFLI